MCVVCVCARAYQISSEQCPYYWYVFDPHSGMWWNVKWMKIVYNIIYQPHWLRRVSIYIFTLVRTLCNTHRSMFSIILLFCINKINVLMSAHAASNWKKIWMNENYGKNKCISISFLGRPQYREREKNMQIELCWSCCGCGCHYAFKIYMWISREW